MFLYSYHWKKHCGRNRIDHGHPCRMEFTLVSLYSTEITRYHSWFLEYKLTGVNSVLHRHQWWILYILDCIKTAPKFIFKLSVHYPEQMFTYHQWSHVIVTLGQFHQKKCSRCWSSECFKKSHISQEPMSWESQKYFFQYQLIEADWTIYMSVNLQSLVQIMACHLAIILYGPMLEYC